MKRGSGIALVCAGLLSACGALNRLDSSCAELPGGGSYCLQPSTDLAPFDLQQKVESTLQGRRETLIVEFESDAKGLRFAGLTPFGQKLLQVSYDNHVATAQTLPDARLSPTMLLALLQMALWPADSVRRGLAPTLRLEEDARQRRVLRADRLLLSIDYSAASTPNRLHVLVPSLPLELDISPLPPGATEP